MKKKFIIGGVVVGLAVIAGVFYARLVSFAAVGNLDIYTGSATVAHGAAAAAAAGAAVAVAPENGTTGTPVQLSDEIAVASGSRVAIILNDGSIIRLEAGSRVVIADLAYQNGKIKDAVFKLTVGRLWAHEAPLAPGGSFVVETPSITASVRGTAFDTSYASSTSEVFVAKDSVAVALLANRAASTLVDAGYVFTLRDASLAADFALGPIPAASSTFDDWVQFNEGEDARRGETDEVTVPFFAAPSSTPTATPTSTPPLPAPAQHQNPNSKQKPAPIVPVSSPTVPPSAPTSSATPPAPAGPALVSLTLSAAQTSVGKNTPLPLKVIGKYADGTQADLSQKVSWRQSPSLGLVDNLGNFHGFNTGTTDIMAYLGALDSNVVTLTVTAPAAASKTLSRLGVTFIKNPTSTYNYNTAGYFQYPSAQFSATAYWSDGSSQDVTKQATWGVAGGGTARGAITSAGLYTAASAEGADTVLASYSGLNTSTQISFP